MRNAIGTIAMAMTPPKGHYASVPFNANGKADSD